MLQRGTPQSSWALMKRLMQNYLYGHRTAFITAMILMTVAAAMRGIFAHTLQLVIDGMVAKRGLSYMIAISAFIVGIFFVRGIANYIQTILMNKVDRLEAVWMPQRSLALAFVQETALHVRSAGKLR